MNVTRHQWMPHQVQREGEAGGFKLTSIMRMLEDGHGTPGLLFRLVVEPLIGAARAATPSALVIDLAPEVQLLEDMPWNINWPPAKADWVHKTVKSQLVSSGLAGDMLLLSSDTTTSAVAASGIMISAADTTPATIEAPAQHSAGLGSMGPSAKVTIQLQRKKATVVSMFVVAGNSTAAAEDAALALSTTEGFTTAFDQSRTAWASRWQDAFNPSNSHFSGSLPLMTVPNTSDADAVAVQRIYYAGCVTLLACERTNYPLISPRVYLTGFGTIQPFMGKFAFHGGSAAFYWDQSLLSSRE